MDTKDIICIFISILIVILLYNYFKSPTVEPFENLLELPIDDSHEIETGASNMTCSKCNLQCKGLCHCGCGYCKRSFNKYGHLHNALFEFKCCKCNKLCGGTGNCSNCNCNYCEFCRKNNTKIIKYNFDQDSWQNRFSTAQGDLAKYDDQYDPTNIDNHIGEGFKVAGETAQGLYYGYSDFDTPNNMPNNISNIKQKELDELDVFTVYPLDWKNEKQLQDYLHSYEEPSYAYNTSKEGYTVYPLGWENNKKLQSDLKSYEEPSYAYNTILQRDDATSQKNTVEKFRIEPTVEDRERYGHYVSPLPAPFSGNLDSYITDNSMLGINFGNNVNSSSLNDVKLYDFGDDVKNNVKNNLSTDKFTIEPSAKDYKRYSGHKSPLPAPYSNNLPLVTSNPGVIFKTKEGFYDGYGAVGINLEGDGNNIGAINYARRWEIPYTNENSYTNENLPAKEGFLLGASIPLETDDVRAYVPELARTEPGSFELLNNKMPKPYNIKKYTYGDVPIAFYNKDEEFYAPEFYDGNKMMIRPNMRTTFMKTNTPKEQIFWN